MMQSVCIFEFSWKNHIINKKRIIGFLFISNTTLISTLNIRSITDSSLLHQIFGLIHSHQVASLSQLNEAWAPLQGLNPHLLLSPTLFSFCAVREALVSLMMYSFMGGGLFCAIVGNILLVVSTATDYWMQYRLSGSFAHQGLWRYCMSGKCYMQTDSIGKSMWPSKPHHGTESELYSPEHTFVMFVENPWLTLLQYQPSMRETLNAGLEVFQILVWPNFD